MINKGLVSEIVCGGGRSVAGSKSRPKPPQVVPGVYCLDEAIQYLCEALSFVLMKILNATFSCNIFSRPFIT